MRRREFVKAMAAASAAATTATFAQQVAPPPPAAAPPAGPPAPGRGGRGGFGRGFQMTPPPTPPSTVSDLVAATDTGFFTAPQFAALHKLCDLLMPPLNGHPGAIEAGAPEFLDFLIGISPADRQQMYRSGLDRLNANAQKQFGAAFANLNATQADAVIRPGLANWMSDSPPKEPFQRFISLAHRDIRTATMNSQAWSAAASAAGERAAVGLYWRPIDPDIEKYT